MVGQDLSDGTRVDFQVDALGSVVGTVNQSGTVENTYRYNPYGSQLSRTGTDPDPDFTWVGTPGYRSTGLAHSGFYVIGRHFGDELAAWTSVDQLWPTQQAYTYSSCNPTSVADPSGQATGGCTPAQIAGCQQMAAQACLRFAGCAKLFNHVLCLVEPGCPLIPVPLSIAKDEGEALLFLKYGDNCVFDHVNFQPAGHCAVPGCGGHYTYWYNCPASKKRKGQERFSVLCCPCLTFWGSVETSCSVAYIR